jgi:hypothetical protein
MPALAPGRQWQVHLPLLAPSRHSTPATTLHYMVSAHSLTCRSASSFAMP